MFSEIQIKVCDIRDIHTARLCGNLGIDWIGLHGIYGVKLENSILYSRIIQELSQFYPKSKPVLVTKLFDSELLSEVISKHEFSFVQIYILNNFPPENFTNKTELEIEAKVKIIVDKFFTICNEVNEVVKREVIFIPALPIMDYDISTLEKIIDNLSIGVEYILFDSHCIGGSGKLSNLEKLRKLLISSNSLKVFIAGGLNPANIGNVLLGLKINNLFGVDVQSGVSLSLKPWNNPKDPTKLIKFVSTISKEKKNSIRNNAVNFPSSRNKLVSWSITDLENDQYLPLRLEIIKNTDVDLVHLDFSDGSIAPQFKKMPFSILRELSHISNCSVYDIHLFIMDVADSIEIIRECLDINPLLRVVYIHQSSVHGDIILSLKPILNFCTNTAIKVGLALQATQFSKCSILSLLEKLKVEFQSFKEISLITHSRRHSTNRAVPHDINLAHAVREFLDLNQYKLMLSIDRDMTFNKAQDFTTKVNINHIIVGKALNSIVDKKLSCPDDLQEIMQKEVMSFRNLLN